MKMKIKQTANAVPNKIKVDNERAACQCWKIQKCPDPPTLDMLPFNVNNVENQEIKMWIENYYAASAYNKCTYQLLPGACKDNPMRLHLKEGSKHFANYSIPNIPVHFQDEVKAKLEEDIRLKVIK